MDEENSNVNRLDTILGVKEDKSVGNILKHFTKQVEKVPEKREVELRPRADFRKANKDLNERLKKWDKIGKKREGKPLFNYFFGNKHKVNATKKLFNELEREARKATQKYNNILNDNLGADRDQHKGKGFQYNGQIGKTRDAHRNNLKARAETQDELNALTREYNELLKKQSYSGLLENEASAMEDMEKTRQRIAELEKQRSDMTDSVFDSVQPMKIINTQSKIISERNKELSKLAGGFYQRTGGDKTLFKILEKEINASYEADKKSLDDVRAKLDEAKKKKKSLSGKLGRLEAKPQTEETDKAIADIRKEIVKAETTIKKLTRDRKIAEGYVNIDKKQQKQYSHYWENRHQPQDFAEDKNYKDEEFAPKFDAMMRKKTSSIKEMVDKVGSLSTPKSLDKINETIDNAYESVAKLQSKLQEITSQKTNLNVNLEEGENEEAIATKMQKKKKEINEANKKLKQQKIEGKELVRTFHKLKVETKEASRELRLLRDDMNVDPIKYNLESSDLKKYNTLAQDIKNNVIGIGRNWKKSNVFTRLASRILINIRSQIADMINPLTLFRKGWDAWLNRFDNLPWKNTFEVISYNLVTAFEPVFKWLAQALIKVAQFFNPLFKKLAGVDLFDKSAWSLEKIKKGVGQLTASFDELHSSNENPNEFNTAFDLGQIEPLSDGWQKAAEAFADGFISVWKTVTGFIKEHPLLSAVIAGLTWLGGPSLLLGIGKGLIKGVGTIAKGIWKGVKWLGPKIWTGVKGIASKITSSGIWGKTTAFFKGAGTKIGTFLNKGLYTGMSGATVTMGKLLGGTALVATGVVTAGSAALKAGKNWQDYNTAQKVGAGAMVGLGSAAAGLGAVMLGASGPVGWAIAGVVALGSLCIGLAQTQDGIGSVKEETEKLAEAQNNAAIANDNYNTAISNLSITMSNLEQLEQQTGLSGAELAEQVRTGKLEIDKMTASQLRVYDAYIKNEEMLKQLKEATEQKKQADKEAVLQSLRVEAANAIEADSYDTLRDAVVKAWEEGSISAEEGAEIMSRALANADDKTQEVFGKSIPEEMQSCFNPDRYESGWRKFGNAFKSVMNSIGDWFAEKWRGIKSWWNSLWGNDEIPEPSIPSGDLTLDKAKWNGASYAVGTNYVPNDQLAMVHKGEAIIPAKYNKPYSPSSNSSNLESTVAAMTHEIANLRSLIQGGIPVKGEFKQRGADLVAVVEKGKNRIGNQALSNPAYAR